MSLVKKFGIPATGALVLAVNVGCGPDPIFGDWEGTSFTYDGDRRSLPFTETYYDNYGNAFEVRLEINIVVEEDEKDLKGELEQTIAVVGGDSEVFVYDIEGKRTEKGVWDVQIEDANDLEVVCTAVDDELDCDGEDAGGIETKISFDRK